MSGTRDEVSRRAAAAVEGRGASVVQVVGRRRGPSSGVVVAADGVVVTASHVLEWDEDIEVGLADDGTTRATLLGRDPATDLAVLRTGSSLTPVDWADAADLRVGHLVLALSRPGRSVRASLGIVSAAGGEWRTPAGGRVDRYVQTDVGLHVGFSGGLLVDLEGGALGVNTAGLLRGSSLALPGPTVRRVVDAILAHGQVRRGYLGIGTFPVHLPAELEGTAGQPGALLVLSVEPDSPAARAGLLLGDAILSLDGRPLKSAADLLPLLEEDRIGAEGAARIVRAGELREVRVRIGARGERG